MQQLGIQHTAAEPSHPTQFVLKPVFLDVPKTQTFDRYESSNQNSQRQRPKLSETQTKWTITPKSMMVL